MYRPKGFEWIVWSLAGAVCLLLAGCGTYRPPVIDQGERIIHAMPEDVDRLCYIASGQHREFTYFGIVAGCYDPSDDVIILPFPDAVVGGVGGFAYSEIRAHEMCHRLGWPADHRGARPKGCGQ